MLQLLFLVQNENVTGVHKRKAEKSFSAYTRIWGKDERSFARSGWGQDSVDTRQRHIVQVYHRRIIFRGIRDSDELLRYTAARILCKL